MCNLSEIKGCDSNPPFCHASSTCVKNDDGFICECQNGKILSLSGNGTVVCNGKIAIVFKLDTRWCFSCVVHHIMVCFCDKLIWLIVHSVLSRVGHCLNLIDSGSTSARLWFLSISHFP